jgi:hypothetical protein
VPPQALETSAETVTLALDQTVREIELAEKREAEALDKIWRENFVRMPSFSQSGPCQARLGSIEMGNQSKSWTRLSVQEAPLCVLGDVPSLPKRCSWMKI